MIEAHRAAGRRFEAANCASFVREEGDGDPVVLLHGVPVSSFLWRKVLPELSGRGLRGVAFDFPGLGLADRPEDFDYSWGGLAAWTAAAIDALGLDRYHLVVHDIGGPVGFEVAINHRDRIRSLTALNTLVDAGSFHRPWQMHPFSIPVLGEIWLRSMNRHLLWVLFNQAGIAERRSVPREEIYAHYDLLKMGDGGRAFLKIMRGFELTGEKERFFFDGLAGRPYPAQVVWGDRDPALGAKRRAAVERALGLKPEDSLLLPAKHFLQEDFAPHVAEAIASIAA